MGSTRKNADLLPLHILELLADYDSSWAEDSQHEAVLREISAEYYAKVKQSLREIDDCHRQGRGIPDFGYNFVDVRKAGSGGMGNVYKAQQLDPPRTVAIKVAKSTVLEDAQQLRRFFVEVESVSRFSHPNLIEVHDVGEVDQYPYYVMEWMNGGSLHQWVGEQPLNPKLSARLVRDLAVAVEMLHRNGIIHRDLKPQNVLMSAPRLEKPQHSNFMKVIPKLCDFGLAKNLEDTRQFTGSNVFLGTLSYMAPEQLRGGAVGVQTDVYGLGAILYFCATAKTPIKRVEQGLMVREIEQSMPESPRKLVSSIPLDLETICLKCLAKSPDDRYQTASSLIADLNRFLNGDPISARPPSLLRRAVRWIASEPILACTVAIMLVGFFALTIVSTHHKRQAVLASVKSRESAEKLSQSVAELESLTETLQYKEQSLKDSNAQLRSALESASSAKASARRQRDLARASQNMIESLFEGIGSDGVDYAGTRYGGSLRADNAGRVHTISGTQLLERGKLLIDRQASQPSLFRCSLLLTLGKAARNFGNVRAAESLLEEADCFLTENSETDEDFVARVKLALGRVYHDLGKLDLAIGQLNMALNGFDRVSQREMLPSQRESIMLERADACFHLGWVHSERRASVSDVQTADGFFRQSQQIRSQYLGKSHRLTKYAEAGRLVNTLFDNDRSLEKLAELSLLLKDDIAWSDIMTYWSAVTQRKLGNYEVALTLYQQSLSSAESKFGKDHPIYVMLLGDYAGLLRDKGDSEEGLRVIDQAIETGRRIIGAHPKLLEAMFEAAKYQREQGRMSDAARRLRECLALAKRLGGRASVSVQQIESLLATTSHNP